MDCRLSPPPSRTKRTGPPPPVQQPVLPSLSAPSEDRRTPPDFMTWGQICDHLLQEGHLSMVAIFDLDGTRLAATPGVGISEEEAQDLVQSLRVPTCAGSHMYGLFLGGVKVHLLRGDERSLIGKTSGQVFVAYRAHSVLLCGYGPLGAKGSCLGSVREAADKLSNAPPVSDLVMESGLL